MPGMSPEEMAQMQAQAGKEQGPSLIDLAQKTGAGLQKLSEALEKSPQSTPEEKSQMAQVLAGFVDLVEKKLGSDPGAQGPQAEPLADGAIPMEGGLSGVPMNMKMKQ